MISMTTTSSNSVFAVRSAHPNAFGTSQTRETLSEIAIVLTSNGSSLLAPVSLLRLEDLLAVRAHSSSFIVGFF
jgi:hypothetical protein